MKALDLIVNIVLLIIFVGLAVGTLVLLFAMAKKSFISFMICSTLTVVAGYHLGKAMP